MNPPIGPGNQRRDCHNRVEHSGFVGTTFGGGDFGRRFMEARVNSSV